MIVTMNFMSWNKATQALYWPPYDDTDDVNGKFIYRNDIKVFESEKKKNQYHSVPDYKTLKQEYIEYRNRYGLK